MNTNFNFLADFINLFYPQTLINSGLHGLLRDNYVDIPENFQGEIMEICFSYVASPTEPVAVKAFSLTVLGNLAKQYPEIMPEIKILIDEQLPHQTAAFKSRAKKISPLSP